MNYTIEGDILTIIQDEGSSKPDISHHVSYGIDIMEGIQTEISRLIKAFDFVGVNEALQRLSEYKPMYDACVERMNLLRSQGLIDEDDVTEE